MSSHGSPTLDLDVRSRRTEGRVAGASVVLATACPWLTGMEPAQLTFLSLLAGLVVAMAFWRSGWIGTRHRIVRIAWLADGRWLLTAHSGERFEAELSQQTRRWTALASLRWQSPHRHSMLLARGDLAAPDLRRLLVRLGIDGLRSPLAVGFADPDAGPGEGAGSARLCTVASLVSTRATPIPHSTQPMSVAPTRRP